MHTLLPAPALPWTEEPSEVPAVDYWFRESERVWDSVHIHLQQEVRRHKLFADVRRSETHSFQPGNPVWLSIRDLRLPCKKLSPRYIGPFPIQRQVCGVHPTFHVSLLKPFSPSTTGCTKPDAPPPPEGLKEQSIRSVKFWTHGEGAPGLSTWWTGRDMDRKKDPGWTRMIL